MRHNHLISSQNFNCIFTNIHCHFIIISAFVLYLQSVVENRHLKLCGCTLLCTSHGNWQRYYKGVLICPSLLSSPSSVSRFCAFSSSSSYRRLEMSCLISFSSPEEKQTQTFIHSNHF